MKPLCSVYSNITNQVEFIEQQEEWSHKWTKGIMWYDVIHHESLKLISQSQLRRAVNLAMTTWDIEIPIKYKPVWMRYKHQEDIEPDITIEFKNRSEDVYLKERPSVLAYAYLPGQGDYSGRIVFCADYIWDLKGEGIKGSDAIKKGIVENAHPDNTLKTYNLYHVLIHELGHSLGLKHDTDRNSIDVMDPYYKGTNLDLSERDIYRIRLKYGVTIFKWNRYMRIKKWLRNRIRR